MRLWVVFAVVGIAVIAGSLVNIHGYARKDFHPAPLMSDSPIYNNITGSSVNFTIVQVSNNTPEANEIFLSRGSNGVFYMGWNDYRNVNWSDAYVHLGFSYSTNGGLTWSTNQVLGNHTSTTYYNASGDPVVVPGDGDDVYYLLMEFTAHESTLKHSQLVVVKSTDDGNTWSDEAVIWKYDVDKPWAVYWNGNLYVAWDNVSSGNMMFTHTINGNIHQWSPIKTLSSTMYPGMAINETGTIYVVGVSGGWFTYSMSVYVSTDGGNTFTSHNLGSISSSAWESNPRSGPIPQIAAKGSDAYAVWVNNVSYSQVYMAESHDGGNTWTTKEVGDITGNYRYMYPTVSISPNGIVHLAYYRMEHSTKKIEVIYRSYDPFTAKFSPEVVVDSWTNTNSFIGDYITIVADEWGNVSIGYTTENPTDNAMFATMSIPVEITNVWNSSVNGTVSSGDALIVRAHVTSASGINNVTLYYRFENNVQYSMIQMNLTSGNEFNGTWEGSITTTGKSGKLYFYVYADDGKGKYAQSVEYDVNVISTPEIPALILIIPVVVFIAVIRFPSIS